MGDFLLQHPTKAVAMNKRIQMEHEYQKPSDVSELMPCPLDCCILGPYRWTFWSSRPNDELEYQSKKMDAPVVPTYPGIGKDTIRSIFGSSPYDSWLVQFWSPVKVNGSTFLSTADQPFVLDGDLDKRLCTYRRHCLDTLIPVDMDDANGEALLAPLALAFIRGFPEYHLNIENYSAVEFPLLQHAIQLGIRTYCATPVFKLHETHCLGVFEFAFAEFNILTDIWKGLDLGSYGLYSPGLPMGILLKLSQPWEDALDEIQAGLDVVRKRHKLPFAEIWIPDSQSSPIKALIATHRDVCSRQRSKYPAFSLESGHCFIQRGKAVVGRAFSSQGSCFCKDVTLFSMTEYPLVRSARKAEFTKCFAICLRSKCANNFIYVVECFLRPNKMVNRDPQTFLNMLLSTMKEQLPGVTVASGQELGQRMVVEVVKVSPSDELDSFEIGRPLLSVQSLQGGGGETTKINSLPQQSYLQNVENNAATAPVVPSSSSHRLDSLNHEGPVRFDLLLQHPTEKAVANRRRVDTDVADDHIEIEKDMSEMMQPDCHFEQPNLEIDSTGNARSNDRVEHSDIAPPRLTNLQKIHSQKDTIKRIEKDHRITREILEQHFGMERKDAAKTLEVSVSTLKRICREHGISRWPHYKTRKVNHHASKGVAVQGVEPYVRDQERPDLSQEKGTDYLVHKPSPATGKACESVMTVKVTYKDDIIKFKLTASSTRVELQEEVEKRLNISLEKFSIKYQDEDDDWVTITGDSDLREGMSELRFLGKTTMKLLVTPKSET